jgi:putative hydrolase of the HAD superfamily
MNKRVQAVIFDWYGTLVQPTAEDWWPRVPEFIERAGGTVPPDALWRWAHAPIEHTEHSRDRAHYDRWITARLQELLGACGLDDAARETLTAEIQQANKDELVGLVEGGVAVIDELHRRGLKVALCSNWDWDLDRHLAGNALTDHFDAVVCSAHVGYRKPHEQIFSVALDAIGVAPEEALFVGDDWGADIEGALAAGMTAVHAGWAVPCGQSAHLEVRCCATVEALLELPELAS